MHKIPAVEYHKHRASVMIYLFGFSVACFLVFLLIGEKNKSASTRILTAWLAFCGLHLAGFYAFSSGAYVSFPFYLGFELPLPFVHGPFLYWYTSSLTDPPEKRIRAWPHFIPFLATYVILAPFLILPVEQKVYVYQHKGVGYEEISTVMNTGIMFSGVAYVVLSLLKLRRYKRFIQDRFSDTENINLAWLRYLILGISLIWVFVILGDDQVIFAIATLFVLFIGYFGIKQVGILAKKPVYEPQKAQTEQPPPPRGLPEEQSAAGKYEKSGLKEEQVDALHQRLQELMEQERPFVDPELALSDLARRLDIHPNYLSQLINSIEQKNFYDYINAYRIEEFKRIVLLPENQRYTLLTLAFECGFSSKTSFNRNFKKVTGVTPSAYLNGLHIHLEQ